MSRGTILIVDDDDDWRKLLFDYLADSYDVMAIEDYVSASAIIQSRSFDAIILDLRLEDQNENDFRGLELLDLLRKKEAEGDWKTSVIIVSAYGTRRQIRDSFNLHNLFDYIPKQEFDRRDYQEVVRQAVYQSRHAV
jgi:DNA-binding NtrC family response regulator